MSKKSTKLNRQSEVIYQIYPSSFNDSKSYPLGEGDYREVGLGDLDGITQKLDYIKNDLGVDAIWISPFFKTPAGAAGDGGYAVSDYRKVDPRFGKNEDFEKLIAEAHKKGLRVYTDFVMCHTSNQHKWFEKSSNPDDPEYEKYKDYYVWSDGKRDENSNLILENGKPLPPNNWKSVFGDQKQSAWEFNEKRGQFYLHHFNTSQPAINSNLPNVQDAVISEMKYWLDKGVDGLRLDALPYANYDPELRDNPARDGMAGDSFGSQYFEHSICQNQTIRYVKKIREMLDSYSPPRTALGEAIAGKYGGYNAMPIASSYVNEKTGLHSVYVEPFGWPDHGRGKFTGYPSAGELRDYIKNIEKFFPDGAMCNYLSNHDFSRAATRMLPHDCPEELRVTALKQLMAINYTLPGSVCMYQGEELGLPDARIGNDVSLDKLRDTVVNIGACRDIARTPMPWDNTKKNAGFSQSDTPYLPVPTGHYALAANLQELDPPSVLQSTKRRIQERKNNEALRIGTTTILDTPEPVFAFIRQTDKQAVLFVANMSRHQVTFRPRDYIDDATIRKIHGLQADEAISEEIKNDEMLLGGYYFSRRGLHGQESYIEAPVDKTRANGHTNKRVFTADLLIADIFHNKEKVAHIVQEKKWDASTRESIDRTTHAALLEADGNAKTTIGGSTLLTLDTLKKLNPNTEINFLGVCGNDERGKLVKDHLKNNGINLITDGLKNTICNETATSHIISTGFGDIVVTNVADEAKKLRNLAFENKSKLLEDNIKHSDIVYLSGSLIEKFGKPFVDEILRLRWKHEKELVLALPVHATYNPDDISVFRGLMKSSNVVVGNDTEYSRIYELPTNRPVNDEQIDKIVTKIQDSFTPNLLKNNDMPCPRGQVAFITRGNKGALIVTAKDRIEIPPASIECVKNILGSGDTAMAAFLDAEFRGLNHEQSARYAMAMAAEKVQQADNSPYLLNPQTSREKAFLRNDIKNLRDCYNAGSGEHSCEQPAKSYAYNLR